MTAPDICGVCGGERVRGVCPLRETPRPTELRDLETPQRADLAREARNALTVFDLRLMGVMRGIVSGGMVQRTPTQKKERSAVDDEERAELLAAARELGLSLGRLCRAKEPVFAQALLAEIAAGLASGLSAMLPTEAKSGLARGRRTVRRDHPAAPPPAPDPQAPARGPRPKRPGAE